MSLTVGALYVTLAEQAFGSVFCVMGPGQAIIGASLSSTVTVKLYGCEVLPASSLAVQVTVVAPLLNVEPEAWSQFTVTPGQLSLADGAG